LFLNRKPGPQETNMSWLSQYARDIIDLESAQAPDLEMGGSQEPLEKFAGEFKKIMEPLRDGTLDPGDIEAIVENHWEVLGEHEIEAARDMAGIQRRLAPMYERLATAGPEDWAEYVQIKVKARYTHGMPLWLLARVFRDK
jgi:hypothetical protein